MGKETQKGENGAGFMVNGENETEGVDISTLPIFEHQAEIKEMIANSDVSLIIGETGSGKTIGIPGMVLDCLPPNSRIAVTQPRRIAATSVASFVASRMGVELGEEVGYQIRFDDREDEKTLLTFQTDGILLQKIKNDPMLTSYDAVMVDEAHERSLNIDFLLGLLKRAQAERAKNNIGPLKIIVSSATLEKVKFTEYFDHPQSVEVPGRLFPVSVEYLAEEPRNHIDVAAIKVEEIIESGDDGDILIFMPGEADIRQTIRKIEERQPDNVVCYPCYGRMNKDDQDKIFEKSPGRKVIVATNIAETSLTIPGIKHVVDSGLINVMTYNPKTRISSLETSFHSRGGCNQRSGRAGRVEEGKCYRLFTKEKYDSLDEFQQPEIFTSNLAQIVLTMKKMGIDDISGFDFIDRPDPKEIDSVEKSLFALGALDEDGNITDVGEKMSDLPLEPHIAKMVLEAEKYGCVETICTIASFVGLKSPFNRPRDKEFEADSAHRKFIVAGSDFLTNLKIFENYQENRNNREWATENFINTRTLREVEQIRIQLLKALRRNGVRISEDVEPDLIAKSIASGLVEDILMASGFHAYRRLSDDESGIFIHPSSSCFYTAPRFLATAEIVNTSKTYARMNQAIDPRWLPEIAPHLVETQVSGDPFYNETRDKVVQEQAMSLRGEYVNLGHIELDVVGEQAVSIFADYLSRGNLLNLPEFEENKAVFDRLGYLWIKSQGSFMPELDREFTESTLKNFYFERLSKTQISSKSDLLAAIERGEVDISLVNQNQVPEEEVRRINEENPDILSFFGNELNLRYRVDYENGNARFHVLVEMDATEILKLNDLPKLPSGRSIEVSFTSSSGLVFSSTARGLNWVKDEASKIISQDKWAEFIRSQTNNVEVDPVEIISGSFRVGDPIQYGTDEISGDPLLAYPALVVDSLYIGHRYLVQYFRHKTEADSANTRATQHLDSLREKLKTQMENVDVVTRASNLLQIVSEDYEIMSKDPQSFGLGYYVLHDMDSDIKAAKRLIDIDPQKAYKQLTEINLTIDGYLAKKEQVGINLKLIQEAVDRYYSLCPLCGEKIISNVCESSSSHNQDNIDFEYDSGGSENVERTILSSLVSKDGITVARADYVPESKTVKIISTEGLSGDWKSADLSIIQFIDNKKVLSEKEAEERARILDELKRKVQKERLRDNYESLLLRAEENVKNGSWSIGGFNKVEDKKTGESRWERIVNMGSKRIIFIVDKYGRQPTSQDYEYYHTVSYSYGDVDTQTVQVINVFIESPFPEDRPEPETSSIGGEGDEEVTDDMLKKLEEWGSRR